MTNIELQQILLKFVKQGNCFTKEVRNVLLKYKRLGGTQEIVVQILNKIKNETPNNQTIQDGADDILDIATGYCNASMRVWE